MPRFVAVPAVPKETGSMRIGSRFYCTTGPIGFNIYDSEARRRLPDCYSTRDEANEACKQLNTEHLQNTVTESAYSSSSWYWSACGYLAKQANTTTVYI